MENRKAIFYLLAFGQGMILSVSLIFRGILKDRASLFLGIILFVLAAFIGAMNELYNEVDFASYMNSAPTNLDIRSSNPTKAPLTCKRLRMR